MRLRWIARSAALAEIQRERIRRTGMVFGRKIWTPDDDAKLTRLHPDYPAMIKAFKDSRTKIAVYRRVSYIGIAKRSVKKWMGTEVVRLRRMYPRASWDEIAAAFPGRSRKSIEYAAQRHHLRRPRAKYAPTGIDLLDAIRGRCAELRLTMRDLDAMARTKHYFSGSKGRWTNHKALALAVRALGGKLVVMWE